MVERIDENTDGSVDFDEFLCVNLDIFGAERLKRDARIANATRRLTDLELNVLRACRFFGYD